jgi:protease I
VTASTVQEATGKFGSKANVDILLKDVAPEDYDAVLFVGGPGTFVYFEDPTAHSIARAFYEAGKPTCAICAAPGILAHAGLLKGKRVTSWPGVRELVEEKGGIHTQQPVEQEGTLITADGPSSAKAFGEKIAEALTKRE